MPSRGVCWVWVGSVLLLAQHGGAQTLMKPAGPGERVTLLPSDMAVLEAGETRKDLPCTVSQQKPQLGFDLRFHAEYDVVLPLRELAGPEQLLTVVFRVNPADSKSHPAYFVQHFRVPRIDDDAKGDALVQGEIDLGEGNYHVDWLMRDAAERICSSSWDVQTALPPKDKAVRLFLGPNEIAEPVSEPFATGAFVREPNEAGEDLNVKLLVNFAPQNDASSSLQRSDTDALLSILKTIERDPRVGSISLVAFNMEQGRVLYRQEAAEQIDFPALGKALSTIKLGTVDVQRLSQKNSETDFLEHLIEKEIGTSDHPDAIIFAGPKAMLNADVPQEDLRRIGDVECPVFYMNYNLNPEAVPWKDSISHAIRVFKGTEYTISQPRDLWFSTSDMVGRILKSKKDRTSMRAAGGGAAR